MHAYIARKSKTIFRHIVSTFATLSLLSGLTACGGGGGGSAPPDAAIAASKLFAGDAINLAIGSITNLNPSPGALAVDRIIIGSNTAITSNLSDFAMDAAHDRLYVANGKSILVFDNISTASGNLSPARVVSTISNNTIGTYICLSLDTVHDVLYAGNINSTSSFDINVFNSASSANNASPNRTFTVGSNFPSSIGVDVTRDLLYVYAQNNSNNLSQVLVVANASTASGGAAASRIIYIGSSYSSGQARGIYIDSVHDRLYVSNYQQIFVFDSVSTKNGPINTTAPPDRIIQLPVPQNVGLTLDPTADRLYAAAGYGVYIIGAASTANGAVSMTLLQAPNGGSLQAVAVRP